MCGVLGVGIRNDSSVTVLRNVSHALETNGTWRNPTCLLMFRPDSGLFRPTGLSQEAPPGGQERALLSTNSSDLSRTLPVLWLLWWLSGKEPTCQCRRRGYHPLIGKIPWRRNGNPLQYSCLEDPTDRGTWRAALHGVERVGHDLVTELPPPPSFSTGVLPSLDSVRPGKPSPVVP